MHKDLIVAIFVPTTGAGKLPGCVGTGYPVTEDLILTSRHVIEPENRDNRKSVLIRWFHDKPGNGKPPPWIPLNDHKSNDVLVWAGAGNLDAALIRCRRPEYLRRFAVGRLVDRRPAEGERWQSAGFARANKRAEVREPGNFGGILRETAEAAAFFELLEDAKPIAEEQWKGVSGMPVFAESDLLGVVKHVPPNYDHKKLEAVPVWRLFQDEGFRKALGLDEELGRLERARLLLRRLLERSDEVTRELAAALKMPCSEILECRKQVVELLLTETPPLERLFELALSIKEHRRAKQDRSGAQVMTDLVLTILPAIHDAALVADVRRRRHIVSEHMIALPTKLGTLAEIIMAGADRRAASLRPPATNLKFPEGLASLPEPPESGRDADGKQFTRDWQNHLLETFDIDLDRFKGDFQRYLKERFIPNDLRSPSAGISEQELLDTVEAQLRLEAEAKDGGFTYYFIVRMPENHQAWENREKVLAELKTTFPHIAFLRLAGAEPLNVEWSRYGRLRDLLHSNLTNIDSVIRNQLPKETVYKNHIVPAAKPTKPHAGKPVIQYFISYAHDDKSLKDKLLKPLKQRLDIAKGYCFEAWDDGEILPGERWHERIQAAIARCHFGLLLISPAFLGSKYIQDYELGAFVATNLAAPEPTKRAISVALKCIPFDNTIDLKGLERLQIFQDSAGRAFDERGTSKTRDDFASELFQQILQVVKQCGESP